MVETHQFRVQDALASLVSMVLLVVAMLAPLALPYPLGMAFSFTFPIFVCVMAWNRPAMGNRWFVLASFPIIVWGFALLAEPVFGIQTSYVTTSEW